MEKREREEEGDEKTPKLGKLYNWTEGGKAAENCLAPLDQINPRSGLGTVADKVIMRCALKRETEQKKPERYRIDIKPTVADAADVAANLGVHGVDRSKIKIIGDGTYGTVFSVPVNGSAVAMKMQYCADREESDDAEHGLAVAEALRGCDLVEFKAKAFEKELTESDDGRGRTRFPGGLVLTFMPVLKSVKDFCKWPDVSGPPVAVLQQADMFADFLESICACLDGERAVFPDMKLRNIAYCEKQAAFRLIDLDGLVGFSGDPGEKIELIATYPAGTSQPGASETWGARPYTYKEGRLQTRYACAVTAYVFIDSRREAKSRFLFGNLNSNSNSFANRKEFLLKCAEKMQKIGGLEKLGKFIASAV